MRIIAKNRYGVSQSKIIEQSKHSKGGYLVEKLKELKDAGFILSFKPYQHKSRGIYYRVVDEYTLFYLHWIEPEKDALQNASLPKGYWQDLQLSPAWHTWAGLAFESMVLKHLLPIRAKLGIPASAIAYSWRYVPMKKSPANYDENGAQIDLLFDRRDAIITLCEIKYSATPFVIDKQYAKCLANKEKVFVTKTKTQKQIFMTMIAASGIKSNMYSEEIITGVVTLDDLFA